MKYIFFFFFCIATSSGFTQVTVSIKWSPHIPAIGSDTIYYKPKQKLLWQDFAGKPGEPLNASALTTSGFGYRSSIQYLNDKTDIMISVYCYFGKKTSWVRAGKESAYALNHEQHHFDITYLVTNLFVKKLKALKFTRNNYNMLLEQVYIESYQELEKMQNNYDGQTRNGRLKNIQSEWNEKIEKQLGLL